MQKERTDHLEKKNQSSKSEPVESTQIDEILFSAVVPVYNVESYLEKCVDSLIRQENMDGKLEILLIDDGSQDQSGRMCDQLAERYPQIKVYHKKNGGLSSARNAGIEQAAGQYVFFVDSDDYVDTGLCKRLCRALEKYGEIDAICFDGMEENKDQKKGIRRIPLKTERCIENGKDYLLEHYKTRNLNVEAWLYSYRKKFLQEHGLYFREGRLHEDVDFTPRAMLACRRIVEVPDRLYHYVVREDSITTQKNKEKNIRDLFATLKEQCEIAEQQEPELEKWMKNAILNSYLNMVQYARMYRPEYRKLLDRRFLSGKAATNWDRFRVLLCQIDVRLYCLVNDCYKNIPRRIHGVLTK